MSEDTEFAYFAGMKTGAERERQRIIRALKRQFGGCCEYKHKCSDACSCKLIAIIKDGVKVDSNPTETETQCKCKASQ